MNKERNNNALFMTRAQARNQIILNRRLRPSRASLVYILFVFLIIHLSTPVLAQSVYSTPYTFTTLAGRSGSPGSSDGTVNSAKFNSPLAVALDTAGNLYVTDEHNHTVRKVTTSGLVITLAGLTGVQGTNDGIGTAARFSYPSGIVVDTAGNLYVSDYGNNTIRKVTPGGLVSTFVGRPGVQGTNDGTGSSALLYSPDFSAIDNAGNIYVTDQYSTIRKVTPSGVVTTVAGGFYFPEGLAVNSSGNLYVVDSWDDTIRKVTPQGAVTTVAGFSGNAGSADGTNSVARFYKPNGLVLDNAGNLYVSDTMNNTIRKVTPSGTNWVVTTLAARAGGGSARFADGTNGAAGFDLPYGLALDSATNLYVADGGNNSIRKLTQVGTNWVVTTPVGQGGNAGSTDGIGSAAQFRYPDGVAVDGGGKVYVADTGACTIRMVTATGVVTTLAGSSINSGSADGTNGAARFSSPAGLAVDTNGNVFVADTYNNTIRELSLSGTNWVVTTIAGMAGTNGAGSADGTNSAALFNGPSSVAVDSAGNIYVADAHNYTIREMMPSGTNWVVTTIAGLAGTYGSADGTNSAARFFYPQGVAVDSAGNIYVADSDNSTIRKVTPMGTNWVVTTLAGLARSAGIADGTNSAARFYEPSGVAVDTSGNVYVADFGYSTIRKITPAGAVTTLAGVANTTGSSDGTGTNALFYQSYGIAVDSAGNLYVADQFNSTIRKGFPASSVPGPVLQSIKQNGGFLDFAITGLPNLLLDIQSSSDLSHWQTIDTYSLIGGSNYFARPLPIQGPQFYRARVR